MIPTTAFMNEANFAGSLVWSGNLDAPIPENKWEYVGIRGKSRNGILMLDNLIPDTGCSGV
jgi:hypothetical protein